MTRRRGPKAKRNSPSFIAQARIAKGLTQNDMAVRLNLSRASISRIEDGKQALSADLIFPLSRLLDCAVDDIVKSLC
jgi:transcriptional regulator with XRE-family HTH domain